LRELLLPRLTSDTSWSIKELDDELMLALNRDSNRQVTVTAETTPTGTEHTSTPPGA
jgi:hypothetical protein